VELRDFRSNVGITAGDNSLIAQGDFPVKVQSQETRHYRIDAESQPDGSLNDGVAFSQGLHVIDTIHSPDEVWHDV
jgi:hypothetical protein